MTTDEPIVKRGKKKSPQKAGGPITWTASEQRLHRIQLRIDEVDEALANPMGDLYQERLHQLEEAFERKRTALKHLRDLSRLSVQAEYELRLQQAIDELQQGNFEAGSLEIYRRGRQVSRAEDFVKARQTADMAPSNTAAMDDLQAILK